MSTISCLPVGALPASSDKLLIWFAQYPADQLHLLHGVCSWEDGRSTQQLSHNAAHSPHVHCTGVLRPTHDHLWCSVPARSDVVCQICHSLVVPLVVDTSEAKVSQLQQAVRVDKDVSRPEIFTKNTLRLLREHLLDVSVYYIRRMKIFQCLQQLICEILSVLLLQLLR